jgi:outer membrane protein assembly factor BamB
MLTPSSFFIVLFTALVWPAMSAHAEAGWPSWRGPHGDGTAADGTYATNWDEATNILWQVDFPGPGSSTPAIAGGKLFLTHEHEGKNMAVCLDGDGKELWSVALGEYVTGKHKKATGCNPSPVTEDGRVYFYFKSGDLACLTAAGKTLWHINIQKDYAENTLWWDLGTSPVLTSQHVVVAVQQEGPSFVIAFDKLTGNMAWKQDRIFSVPKEAEQSYTTPVVTTFDGQEQIIVLGADHMTSHKADDGSQLWQVGNLNPEEKGFFRSIASPTLIGSTLLAPYARGTTLTAVQLGGSGDVTDTHVLWTDENGSGDVPSPANLAGNVVICTDKGTVRCLNLKTDEEVWSTELPKGRGAFSASPVVAGGHIYLLRENGTAYVLDVDGQIVATNELELETAVATPVFDSDRIYIRGVNSLYCIGQ